MLNPWVEALDIVRDLPRPINSFHQEISWHITRGISVYLWGLYKPHTLGNSKGTKVLIPTPFSKRIVVFYVCCNKWHIHCQIAFIYTSGYIGRCIYHLPHHSMLCSRLYITFLVITYMSFVSIDMDEAFTKHYEATIN